MDYREIAKYIGSIVHIKKPFRKGDSYKSGQLVGLKPTFKTVKVMIAYNIYAGRSLPLKQQMDWMDADNIDFENTQLTQTHESGTD